MKNIMVLCLLLLVTGLEAQHECRFTSDSCLIPPGNTKLPVELIDVKMKDNAHVQFVRYNGRLFLRIVVTANLGFGKTGPLLLKSGTKQMYYKSATLSMPDKGAACFMLELYPNYEVTLREYGLSSIVFNGSAEFSVPHQDSELVKEGARCFYSLTNRN